MGEWWIERVAAAPMLMVTLLLESAPRQQPVRQHRTARRAVRADRADGRAACGLRLSPRYALRLPSRTCRACDATGREGAQADLCAG